MKEVKKPIYKKWWVWFIAILLFVGIVGALTDDREAANEKEDVAAASEKEKPKEVKKEDPKKDKEDTVELSREEEIQALVKEVVDDEFMVTEIKEVAVNPDIGKDDGSFIVLPKFTWEQANKPKSTREMLEMYSGHLAAVLADESDISEITVFWEVPYHLKGSNVAKFSYTRSGDEMAFGEVWYDPLIRD